MTGRAPHATPAVELGDQLSLWLLTQPDHPVHIGELKTVRTLQGVSLTYSSGWVEKGFALSEDLPLIGAHEFLPHAKNTAAGAVDDARPDRWGERVIRFLDKPPRLSLLDYLYHAGDERFGALGVSAHAGRYEPRRFGPLPRFEDANAIALLVDKVRANEPVPEPQRRLIAPGVTLGGARPKALIEHEGAQWVIKFSDGDPVDSPLVEHACMRLASQLGITVADTFAVRLHRGHAVAVRRFDRVGARRVHALSAGVALKAAAENLGYPELAQLLRRKGVTAGGANALQRHELFRRMVFNILVDNTDDHEKNHVLLCTDAQQWTLSPAFDVLPSGHALGYQQMRVGAQQADSTLDNALSECQGFGLKKDDAVAQIARVAKGVAAWKQRFRASGVTAADVDTLAAQIDRPFLKTQRDAFAKRG